MSSPPAGSAADVAPEKTPPARRFPPPCWSQEEALVLIDEYKERWYSLRRGYLRAADWDAVAEAVAVRCPDAQTRKTPAQCRHKMEKLRQRYRAEMKRAASFPRAASGRYFSTWFFFDKMEAMEGGTTGADVEERKSDGGAPSYGGLRNSLFVDQNLLKLKLNDRSDVELGFGDGVQLNSRNIHNHRSGIGNVSYSNHPDDDNGDEFRDFRRVKMSVNKIARHPKFYHGIMMNEDDGLRVKPSSNWIRDKGFERDSAMNKSSKRGRNAVDDIVASIQSLGEGYAEIERAKMELTREMEVMRMEMEMKRNKMMLDSQRQIIDAFVKGMLEMKRYNKKVKLGAKKVELAEA